MTITRRTFTLTGLAAAAMTGHAAAQVPANGRVFVGFPAGGTADATTRRFADLIRGKVASAVIVENRVGAGGRLAVQALKGAAPDGTTLLLSPDSMMTIYTSVYRKLGYDPATEVTPISPICRYTFALGIGPRVPESVRSLADFVAWGKANADAVTYGSPAAGSMPHFLGDVFFRAAGIRAVHNPYRGSAPAINDLLGGHIPSVMTVLGDFLPHVNSPGIRMLGVTNAERSRFMPNVPTFRESGFAQVAGTETYGIFLPGGASDAVVQQVGGLVRDAAANPEMIEGLARIGMDAFATTPSEYRAYLAAERTRWAPVVQASGFSLEE